MGSEQRAVTREKPIPHVNNRLGPFYVANTWDIKIQTTDYNTLL